MARKYQVPSGLSTQRLPTPLPRATRQACREPRFALRYAADEVAWRIVNFVLRILANSATNPWRRNTVLDILVVAPHPDDAEIGAGGAILKCKAQGFTVGVLDLTDGEPTPLGSPEIRARETAAATEILGLDWRENLGLPNRTLLPTLEARAKLAGVFRLTRPRWILAPYWVDAHPDHLAATELVEAARFWAKLSKTDLPGRPHYPERIFYYHGFHLRQIPQPAFILDISDCFEKKRAAIECYRSQFVDNQPPDPPTFLDRLAGWATVWGHAIGARYGEPLASRQPIGLSGFGGLV